MDPEPVADVVVAVSPAILAQSARIAAASGLFGLFLGGVIGTVRKTTPVLFAVATGVQCSTIGASWSATKSFADIYQARKSGVHAFSLSNSQKTNSNTVAGAVTGGLVAAVFRGRSNVLPGMAVFSVAGFLGSTIMNRRTNREALPDDKPAQSVLYRLLHSRFNPMKVLSDEEYEHMLEEKLIRVEAEIALIEENIEKIKMDE